MSEVATWEELKEQGLEEILLDSIDMNMKNSEVETDTDSLTGFLERVAWATIAVISISLIIDWYFFYGKGTIWLIYWASGLFQ